MEGGKRKAAAVCTVQVLPRFVSLTFLLQYFQSNDIGSRFSNVSVLLEVVFVWDRLSLVLYYLIDLIPDAFLLSQCGSSLYGYFCMMQVQLPTINYQPESFGREAMVSGEVLIQGKI